MALEYDERDNQKIFEEKLQQEAKEKEAKRLRTAHLLPGLRPGTPNDIADRELEVRIFDPITAATHILKHFHSFNLLDSKSVRGIGTYFGVDAEAICKHEGITYDIK